MESLLEMLADKFHEIMKVKKVLEDKELENEICKCFPEFDQNAIHNELCKVISLYLGLKLIKYTDSKITWLADNAVEGYKVYFEENEKTRKKMLQDKLDNVAQVAHQHVNLQYIIERNKTKAFVSPPEDRIPLPFTVIRHKNCTMDLESNPTFSQVIVSSYEPFEIQQDYSFLDDMGVIHIDKENVQKYIPPEYIPYEYTYILYNRYLPQEIQS